MTPIAFSRELNGMIWLLWMLAALLFILERIGEEITGYPWVSFAWIPLVIILYLETKYLRNLFMGVK